MAEGRRTVTIDVIIADHQELFQIGMAEVLVGVDDVRIVGQARSSEQLLETLKEVRPHVLVLSTSFLPAFWKIQPILKRRKTALLVLAEENDRAAYRRWLRARGIVNRSMTGPALVDAMRRVAQGELFVQDPSSDMKEERILYVCHDPAALVSGERLLMGRGYQVCTVLGKDGLIAVIGDDCFDFALVGFEGSLAERQSAIRLLKAKYPDVPVIALCRDSDEIQGTNYHAVAADRDTWPDAVAACIGQNRAAWRKERWSM